MSLVRFRCVVKLLLRERSQRWFVGSSATDIIALSGWVRVGIRCDVKQPTIHVPFIRVRGDDVIGMCNCTLSINTT